MKQVIIIGEENVPIVDVKMVSPQKYYGVSYSDSKGFVVRDEYENKNYRARLGRSLTKGNSWNHQSDSLIVLIAAFLSDGYQVFEFNTYQELFRWLASNV